MLLPACSAADWLARGPVGIGPALQQHRSLDLGLIRSPPGRSWEGRSSRQGSASQDRAWLYIARHYWLAELGHWQGTGQVGISSMVFSRILSRLLHLSVWAGSSSIRSCRRPDAYSSSCMQSRRMHLPIYGTSSVPCAARAVLIRNEHSVVIK